MTIMRLIADDLTGALDTAAEFVPLTGPVPVYWNESLPKAMAGSAAFDSGTREKSEAEAAATLAGMASCLAGADIAYKKIDSLLRGHAMAELAACLCCELWDRCIIAPAFPHQGRITSGGVQFRLEAADWVAVADLVLLLAGAGICAVRGSTEAGLPPGVNVFDAATDDDLRRIARLGRSASGRVLWCGSAGLAQALAHCTEPKVSRVLTRPVLGVFGSDQAVTARQLAACGPSWLRLSDSAPERLEAFGRHLDETGVGLASFELPSGLTRAEAAKCIGREIAC
jgi:uncharacterized protein YgbK (DUF1537 family)